MKGAFSDEARPVSTSVVGPIVTPHIESPLDAVGANSIQLVFSNHA